MRSPNLALRVLLLLTDAGFVLYWAVSALHILPASMLFKDYGDPILVAWNWSFLPLDLTASGSGFTALFMARRHNPAWRSVALISLTLTLCAGLLAVCFWTLRGDFNLVWWLPNIFLIVWPAVLIPDLVRYESAEPGLSQR